MTDQKTDTAPKTEAPKAAAAPAPAPKAEAVPAAAKAAVEVPAAAAKAAPAVVKAAVAKAKVRKTRTVKAKAKVRKAPARAVRKTIKTTAQAVNKGTRTMKNEATKVADRIQAVFGDVNERAKTTIERNTRIAEEMTEVTKGNVEAIVASTKLAAKGVETIGQEVAEYSRKSFEEASAALKSFAEVKSPTDLFRLQGEFARTQFDGLIAESSKMSEAMIKLAGDVFAPITNRYSAAAERVKNAVAL